MNSPTINTPRQRRAIQVFLKSGRVTSFELQTKVGVLNAPDLIAGLRRLGWDIPCKKEAKKDRDNNTCYLGFYSLTESSRLQANEVLKGQKNAPE